MNPVAPFLPSTQAALIARCTLVPWVIDVSYEVPMRLEPQLMFEVVEQLGTDAPDIEAMVAERGGVRVIRAEVFPAQKFYEWDADQRDRHRQHYAVYLRWRHAKSRGVRPDELRAWLPGKYHFDPVLLDERLQRWVAGAVRLAGDD